MLDLIEIVSEYPKGISLAEISESSKLAKSTTRRILSCLIDRNYLFQNKSTGNYFLSLKLLEISGKHAGSIDVLSVAMPHLDKLSGELGETVHFVIMDGADVVYLHKKLPMNSGSQMSSRIGARIPMYRTAVGKAILSILPEKEVKSIWESSEIASITPNTITEYPRLINELIKVKEIGYAIDCEENELGVMCVAFPVSIPGIVPTAFSVSCLQPKMTDKRIAEIVMHGRRTQSEIYAGLGLSSSLL
jgi:DNA-binding IclR family transcriptional regulator